MKEREEEVIKSTNDWSITGDLFYFLALKLIGQSEETILGY